jgi:hypothetical protein
MRLPACEPKGNRVSFHLKKFSNTLAVITLTVRRCDGSKVMLGNAGVPDDYP